jgi:hypothetical protein
MKNQSEKLAEILKISDNTDFEIYHHKEMNQASFKSGDINVVIESISLPQTRDLALLFGAKTICSVRTLKTFFNVDGTKRGYKGKNKRGFNE